MHSTLTGELHLEHPPNCNDCGGGGSTDFHGSFTCVGTRTLSLPQTTTTTTGTHKKKGVRVHFFKVSPRPFSFTNLFEPESERVMAAIRIINPACCSGAGPCLKPCCSTGTCTMMGATIIEAVKKSACCVTGNSNNNKVAPAPEVVTKQEEESPPKSCCSKKGRCDSSLSNSKSVEPIESSLEAPRRIINPACCSSDGEGPCPKPCCSTGTCSNMGATIVKAVKSACCATGTCSSSKVAAAEEESSPKSCCSKGKCSSSESVEPNESTVEALRRIIIKPACCTSDGEGPCPKPGCSTGTCSNMGATVIETVKSDCSCSKAFAAEGTKEPPPKSRCSKGTCSSSKSIEKESTSCCSVKGACNKTFSNGSSMTMMGDGVDPFEERSFLDKEEGMVAVGTNNQATNGRRSSFYVARICCASEIPAIHSIVYPMNGTRKVSINVTTKMVRERTKQSLALFF